MPEMRGSFSSIGEWRQWQVDLGPMPRVREQILLDIRRFGFIEPMTRKRRFPFEIAINEADLHESIAAHFLNSRKRALLLQIELELRRRGLLGNSKLRILSADGISRIALILRGRFPYFLGGEYLPTDEEKAAFFPVPHLDLQNIEFPDNSFDLFVSGDVFEHIADLDAALREITRVLRPGGLLISTFPFDPKREVTLEKAKISDTGEIEYLTKPEYHGNPVNPEAGSLVFSLPGWDILDRLKSLGADDAYFSMLASSSYGILSHERLGPMVLSASMAAVDKVTVSAAKRTVYDQAIPRQLVAITGASRSGTTLIASVLSVNSDVEVVYEPWNSKQLSMDEGTNLKGFLDKVSVGNIQNRTLVVKETGTSLDYIKNMSKLSSSLPDAVGLKHIQMIRSPHRTYLSVIKRRNEWWDDAVELGQESFDVWCRHTSVSLAAMLELNRVSGGCLVCLELLASDPEKVIRELCNFMDIQFDRRQIEYEKHYNEKIVRGDKNVASSSRSIQSQYSETNEESFELVSALAESSPHGIWFDDYFQLWTMCCDVSKTVSGICPESSVRKFLKGSTLLMQGNRV